MSEFMMLAAVILPMIAGACIPLIPFHSRKAMLIYIESAVVINSLLVFAMLLHSPEGTITLFRFSGNLSVTFRMDGLGMMFSGLVAVLWPLATLYSFE